MIRSTILSFAILVTFSASAASPEYLVGRSVPGAAPLLRGSPSTASNGDSFFVVWSDSRSGSGAIIGTRVTREGRIVDPLGIRIAMVPGFTAAPQVVWDGTAYLVVWTAGDWSSRDLYAARISLDGGMVMMPRVIAEDAWTGDGRYVASNGSVSVIAYFHDSSARVAVLDSRGDTLHHQTLTDANESMRDLAVAAGSSRFVVAWKANPGFQIEDDVIKAIALTTTGHVIDAPVTVGRGEQPAIGTDGTRFTVVSRKNNDWREYVLLSRTFEADLTPVGNEHTVLADNHLGRSSLLWVQDNHYEVITSREVTGGINEIVSVDIDRDGNPGTARSRGTIYGIGLWLQLAAATNRTDVLVTHTSDAGIIGPQILGRLYPGNVPDAAPMLLSWSGNAHQDPDIASSTPGHIVAWAEDEGIYSTRIDRDGNSLDGRGVRLATRAGSVRAAFDGTNYIVAWSDQGFIGVRTVAPLTGATIAEAQIPVDGWPELALAVSPEATFVVFSNDRIHVTRIPHATHTPDPVPLAVSPEDMNVHHPAAAWNGSTLLVAWEEFVIPRGDPPIASSIKVLGARVTGGLSLLDPAPLLLASTNEEVEQTFGAPSVASNGQDWLVVADVNGRDVVARRVLHDGTVEGSAPRKIAEGIQPVVAWDGTRYALAWKEWNEQQRDHRLALAAIPASGALVAMQRLLVATKTAPSTPSIARGANGELAVAYTKVSFLPEHTGVERTFFRVLDLGAQRGRAVRR
ncbi:MAG: hypothetical protein ACXW31_06635 [Thermoanaerobaculia bacterium]